MSEILQKVSNTFNEKFVKPTEAKFSGFITKHPEIFCLSLLAVLCLLFLFLGLDFYPLLDVDETRYAVMARDMVNSFNWNNMMFNMEPFLEKPPLYFWLVGASVKMLGHFSVAFGIARANRSSLRQSSQIVDNRRCGKNI